MKAVMHLKNFDPSMEVAKFQKTLRITPKKIK
jgi:hypothetical protein